MSQIKYNELKLAYDLLLDRATRLEVENAKLRQENRELREQKAVLRLALIKAGCYLMSDEVACLVASALEAVPDDNLVPFDGQPWPIMDIELGEKGI